MSRHGKRMVPRAYTESLRNEIATELGIMDKLQKDPGSLTAREAGTLGGNITKRLIQQAVKDLK